MIMDWAVIVAISGLCITLGGICVTLGINLQRLNALQKGQDTLFEKFEEIQKDLKNGINKRLGDHSGVINVLTERIGAVEKAAHAEAASIRETCSLRHTGQMFSTTK